MISKGKRIVDVDDLRERAEEIAREKAAELQKDIEALSPEEMREKLNQLRVHQIELEIQNEELKRTQRELEASGDRCSNFYDLSPIGYFFLNEQGLILEANLTADSLLSAPRGSLVRQPLTHYILPEDQKVFYFLLKELFKANDPRAFEIRMLKKDGSPFWVKMEIFPIRHADGTPQCHAEIRDISEHKWSHASGIEIEKHFRTMIEKAPDIFFVHDYLGNFLYVNEQASIKLGYTQEELLKMTAQDIQQTLNFEQMSTIWYSLQVGDSYSTETELRRKDGSVFPVEIRISSLVASTNERIFLGIVHDISDLKQVEQVLCDERWRLQSIIEGACVGTWEWNIQTGETVFNMTWAQMLGYTLDELSPTSIKTWEALVHPDDMKLSYELLKRHFADELPYYTCDCRMKHKAGHWIWIRDRGRIITHTADGKPQMMFGIHTEITEQKRAEAHLKAAYAKLEMLWGVASLVNADVKTISDHILASITQLTNSKYGFYCFVNEDESVMTIHSWSDEVMKDSSMVDKPQQFSVCKAGVWAEAIRRREPLILNDYNGSHTEKNGLPQGHVALTNLLVVPILFKDKITVVAAVANRTAAFGQEDVHLIKSFLGSIQAIVEHRLLVEELKKSEERYKQLFDNMAEGVAVYQTVDAGQDFVFVDMNRPGQSIGRIRLDEAIGRRVTEVFPAVEGIGLLDTFRRVWKTGQPEHHPLTVYKDGRVRQWVENYVYKLPSGLIVAIYSDTTEKKLADAALRESEERKQTILKTSMDGFCLLDMQGQILEVNMTYCLITGYSNQELLSMRIPDLDAVATDVDIAAHIQKIMESGADRFESRHRRKDGSIIDVEVSTQYRPEEGGRIVVFLRDITERKQAREALQESEAKYRLLFETANDAIFIVDMEARILAANPMAERYLGYTHSELMSMTVHQLNSPNGVQLVRQRMPRLMDQSHLTFETEYLRKDGSLIPVEISSRRITWNGQPAIHSICRNISERKKAEELIHDSEQRFRAAFIGNPVAACITRQQDAVWIDANQAELDLFGYNREEFIGKSAMENNLWVDPSDRQRIVEALNQGKAVKNQNVQLRRKDGRLISASVSATGLTLKGEKHILFVTEDITERRLADERIKGALQEKEVLLREIHHRVKNNMQVISSLLFLQASRVENEQGRQALLESQQRILAMAMTHEVLYSGQNLAAIDLSVYLRRLVDHLQGAYNNQSDIRVTFEMDRIEIDINQAVPCSLILNELITNAFKHAFPDGRKGTVRIRVCLSHDKEVVLELSDNGVGFALDQDLSKPSSLGLKLIRRLLIKQLKGRMDMTTEGGTTFTLRWPLPVKSATKLTV
jgi:PAS domain S-box-containing protein